MINTGKLFSTDMWAMLLICFSTALPTQDVNNFLNFCWTYRWKNTYLCSLSEHFLCSELNWETFHVMESHLNFLFDEKFVHVFYAYFYYVISLLWLFFWKLFNVLRRSVFVRWIVSIFPTLIFIYSFKFSPCLFFSYRSF